tara:strand:+ start:1038 stop:1196 length:159 start_codon:yes stop_codon:yes gene_type:complete
MSKIKPHQTLPAVIAFFVIYGVFWYLQMGLINSSLEVLEAQKAMLIAINTTL